MHLFSYQSNILCHVIAKIEVVHWCTRLGQLSHLIVYTTKIFRIHQFDHKINEVTLDTTILCLLNRFDKTLLKYKSIYFNFKVLSQDACSDALKLLCSKLMFFPSSHNDNCILHSKS